jgi:carboxypeptidase family protein
MGTPPEDKVKLFMILQFKLGPIVLAFVSLGWTSLCLGQTPQRLPQSGNISGTVVDQSGAVIAGARVKLSREDPSVGQEVLSGSDGQFSFASVAPGSFQLTTTWTGFATQTFSGVLHPGEIEVVPPIVLAVASDVTEVQVGLTQADVAEEQIKVEEKQRVLGAIPNFYVSYVPNAVPLTSKQKFKLAWKTVTDPFTFVVVGGAAGVEQAQNHFAAYGQGAEGYAKRFGAGYADTATGTFIGGAILPALLKQDPRYFYKGTGSMESRFMYAIANAVICKGDNGRWQASYSNILGSLAAGGISNAYYPANDRDGAELTFENAAIEIGATAVTNLFQEFIIRRLTPKTSNHNQAKP